MSRCTSTTPSHDSYGERGRISLVSHSLRRCRKGKGMGVSRSSTASFAVESLRTWPNKNTFKRNRDLFIGRSLRGRFSGRTICQQES
jgi:hypothetical protein